MGGCGCAPMERGEVGSGQEEVGLGTPLHFTALHNTQHGKLLHRWGWAGAEVDDRRSRGTSGSRSVRSLFFSVNFVTCRMSEHADELPQFPQATAEWQVQDSGRNRLHGDVQVCPGCCISVMCPYTKFAASTPLILQLTSVER